MRLPEVYLADGIWVVEKPNWTGKGLMASRTRYADPLRPDRCLARVTEDFWRIGKRSSMGDKARRAALAEWDRRQAAKRHPAGPTRANKEPPPPPRR